MKSKCSSSKQIQYENNTDCTVLEDVVVYRSCTVAPVQWCQVSIPTFGWLQRCADALGQLLDLQDGCQITNILNGWKPPIQMLGGCLRPLPLCPSPSVCHWVGWVWLNMVHIKYAEVIILGKNFNWQRGQSPHLIMKTPGVYKKSTTYCYWSICHESTFALAECIC